MVEAVLLMTALCPMSLHPTVALVDLTSLYQASKNESRREVNPSLTCFYLKAIETRASKGVHDNSSIV